MMVTFSPDRFLLFLIRQIDWGRRGERKKGKKRRAHGRTQATRETVNGRIDAADNGTGGLEEECRRNRQINKNGN